MPRASTTAAEGPRAALLRLWRRRPPRLLSGVSCLAAALLLLVLCAPVVTAALIRLPADHLQLRRALGEQLSAEREAQLRKAQRAALGWHQTGRAWTDLALAELVAADWTDDPAQARRRLETAEAALLTGISMAPANAYAWTRLALIRGRLRGCGPEVTDALRLAVATGPHEDLNARAQLYLLLRCWRHSSEADRPAFLERIRFMWFYGTRGWLPTEEIFETAASAASVEPLLEAFKDEPARLERLKLGMRSFLYREWGSSGDVR